MTVLAKIPGAVRGSAMVSGDSGRDQGSGASLGGPGTTGGSGGLARSSCVRGGWKPGSAVHACVCTAPRSMPTVGGPVPGFVGGVPALSCPALDGGSESTERWSHASPEEV